MKKLTIGLFLEHYDPFISGVVTSVKALKTELTKRGHKVYIIAPAVRGYLDPDANVIRYKSFSHHSMANTTVGFPNRKIVKSLMKIKFDVVHSEEVFFSAGLAMHIARKQEVPYLQNYHTLWHRFLEVYRFPIYVYVYALIYAIFTYPLFFGVRRAAKILFSPQGSSGIRHLPSRFLWQHMLNLAEEADIAITPSAHLQNELLRSGAKTPIEVIPNGLVPFRLANRKALNSRTNQILRVVCVARLSPEKRVGVAIKAMQIISNAELIVIGDGPEKLKLKQLADSPGLRGKVKFMWELENDIVRQILSEADVLVLASYKFENQPMVILEALAAGLPIIYCDPYLKEGLTPANSLLVNKTPQGFAAGIIKLQDPALRRSMSRASKKEAANFNITAVADQILQSYSQAIASYNERSEEVQQESQS